MANVAILLLIFTVISAGNAQNTFINVHCKTENLGQHGEQSLLDCVIQPAKHITDAIIRMVSWKKEGDERPLLVFYEGKTTPQPRYSFAESSWDKTNMNVSLLISKTAVGDNGVYTCEVMTDSGESSGQTSLKVTAKYKTPTIHSIPEDITQRNTEGALVCNSEGGYPAGRLGWFDVDNQDWTKTSVMVVNQTESGLYHLSSKLMLHGSVFSKYTCVVYNASGDKEAEAVINIPSSPYGQGQEKVVDSSSRIVAPVVVIGSLIVGLLLALLIYKRRTQQARRPSATPLMDGRQVPTHDTDDEDSHQGDQHQGNMA